MRKVRKRNLSARRQREPCFSALCKGRRRPQTLVKLADPGRPARHAWMCNLCGTLGRVAGHRP